MSMKHGTTTKDLTGSFGWRDEFTIPAGTPVKCGQPDCDGKPLEKWTLDVKTAIALSGNEHDSSHRFVIVESNYVRSE